MTGGKCSISNATAANGVLGELGAVGEHHRDRLADVTHHLSAITGCAYGAMVGLGRRNGISRNRRTDIGAVSTARTPGIASAALASIERMRPWATGLRTIAACHMPGRTQIVDILPAPAQEAQVLDALHRAADEGVALHRPVPAESAARQPHIGQARVMNVVATAWNRPAP